MSTRMSLLIAAFLLLVSGAVVAPVIGAPQIWPSSAMESRPATPFETAGQAAQNASENFLRLMRRRDVAGTYALASPDLKAVATQEQFRTMVEAFAKSGMRSVRWGEKRTEHKFFMFDESKGWRWNVYTIEVDGVLSSTGGDTALHFRWVNDDGSWRLHRFRWDAAGKAETKPR